MDQKAGAKNKASKNWRGGLPSGIALDDDNGAREKISSFCFPDIPVHFPLKKKLMLAKTTTFTGMTWENLQLFLTFVICILIILDAYFYNIYSAMRVIYNLEIAITQIFVVDFAFQTYLRSNPWGVLLELGSIFDIITILPVFIIIIYPKDMTDEQFFVLYCCRLLRSVRLFKLLRKLFGKNKHIAMFAIILSCASFFVAGSFYYLENMEYRQQTGCNYIGETTNWRESCAPDSLVPKTEECDCSSCLPYYQMHDKRGHPGRVRCNFRSFFEAIYFTMISGTAIGYGDISALYLTSRLVVLFFIVGTLIAVPIQINTMLTFMTASSVFRAPYTGTQECHVVLCGHVNDKSKLEKFFKEFFHPDRLLTSTEEYHAVILGTSEPTEEVRSLLVSPFLDTRVTYVIGSALSVEDLKRVKAESAAGMFFLCNSEVHCTAIQHEDAATVLRSLSVANFSPELRSLVQILRPEDKAILKDSDVDVILCLDEFKTALIARNAICPGFSTFIENIFHSFGNVSTELENSMDPWYAEYLHGARKEVYYAQISDAFLLAMGYNFRNIAQAVYLEFGIMVIGVCELENQDIVLNPTAKDLGLSGNGAPRLQKKNTFKEFLGVHNVAVILADDQLESDNLVRALANPMRIREIVNKMEDAEHNFKTKHYAMQENSGDSSPLKKFKFIAKNIVAPIKRTAISAKIKAEGRFSKYAKVNSGKQSPSEAAVEMSDHIELAYLRPSQIGGSHTDDTDSSDDENEELYIGFKRARLDSELPAISDASRSMFAKAINAKKQSLKNKAAEATAASVSTAYSPPTASTTTTTTTTAAVAGSTTDKPAMTTAGVTADMMTKTDDSILGAMEEGGAGVKNNNASNNNSNIGVDRAQQPMITKVGGSSYKTYATKMNGGGGNQNQQHDMSPNMPSNEQVLKALKRKSEPPPDFEKKQSHINELDRQASIKRKSEPPPTSSRSIDTKISSRDDSGGKGSMRGPPLAMATPLNSGPFDFGDPSSFAEESMYLAISDKYESTSPKGSVKLKPLSWKESSEKLSARKSAKLKKLKQQVRKNVVVVRSNNHSTKKKSGNSVKQFERLESDLSGSEKNDVLDEESHISGNRGSIGGSAAVRLGHSSSKHSSHNKNPTKVLAALESFDTAASDWSQPQMEKEKSETPNTASMNNSPSVSDGGHARSDVTNSESTPPVSIVTANSFKGLSARHKKLGNVVGTIMAIKKNVKKWTEMFGKESCHIKSADNLKKHIIIFGADSSALMLFISELRRPAIRRLDYHPIVVVGKEPPANWNAIANRYNDIYYMKGVLTKTSTFQKLNIDNAFSIVLFAFSEVDVNSVHTNSTSPDADVLFMYLKLQQYVPEHVFFSVELKSTSNISVLNSTMMRRIRDHSTTTARNAMKHEFSSEENHDIQFRPNEMVSQKAYMPPLLASLSSKYFGTSIRSENGMESNKVNLAASRKVNILEDKRTERMFWDAMDTHHILPVFASGKVYVPETFETLMVQSFYSAMTPIICDKLVCGQKGQAVMQVKLPPGVAGWSFHQLFRIWNQFQVVVFGLFRAPSREVRAFLPYVYICPPANTVIRKGDAVMVYARNAHLLKALSATEKLLEELSVKIKKRNR